MFRRQWGQDLGVQVVGQGLAGSVGEWHCSRRRRGRTGAKGETGQVEADGPALRVCGDLRHLAGVQVVAEGAQEQSALVQIEGDVIGASSSSRPSARWRASQAGVWCRVSSTTHEPRGTPSHNAPSTRTALGERSRWTSSITSRYGTGQAPASAVSPGRTAAEKRGSVAVSTAVTPGAPAPNELSESWSAAATRAGSSRWEASRTVADARPSAATHCCANVDLPEPAGALSTTTGALLSSEVGQKTSALDLNRAHSGQSDVRG